MRVLLAVLSFSVMLGLASCTKTPSGDARNDADHEPVKVVDSSGKEYYTCPMHPSVVSDKPGACPICGMSLVKRSSQGNQSQEDIESFRAVSLSPSQRVMANVSVEPVRRRSVLHVINAVGVIDYAEPFQAKVSARFRGRIEKLYVNYTGDVVHRGQPLFEMYSPDLVSAEREYLLALTSSDGQLVSDADSAQKAQQVAMANAVKDRLRVHYGMTTGQIESIASTRRTSTTVMFASPIHGTVIAKEVQEGQYVDEGMLLYQLADLSRVWAYLDIYEKDLRFIKRGGTVAITADAYPGKPFNGRVEFIDPTLDSQTRTARVRVELNNAEGKLKPQMYVKAEIQIPVPDCLIVPSTALLSTGKRSIVWVEAQSNTFEPRDVVAGVNVAAGVQILSGLNEGEMVAASGGFLLESESQLQHPVAPEGGTAKGKTADATHEVRDRSMSDVRKVRIIVNGDFVPNVIRVKKGETVRLEFYREKESGCVEEVVFESLNLRRPLPVLQTTTIELTPTKSGTISFACGMNMVKGTIVVVEPSAQKTGTPND